MFMPVEEEEISGGGSRMNVLNRSGAMFCSYFAMSIFLFLGDSCVKDFLSGGAETLSVFPLWFFAYELKFFYINSDWYLYKFYPVDFFDRNAQVIILICHAVLVLKLISLLWCAIFLLAIVANDVFMRWYYKRKSIKDLKTREAWGYKNYDAEKIELKTVEKNFFKRTWVFLLALLFLQIVMLAIQKDLFYYLGIVTCLIMLFYEIYNGKKIRKEVEKTLEEMNSEM